MTTDVERLRKLEALANRVGLLINDGDRVNYDVTAEVVFTQGAQTSQQLVFNIPSDGAFFATHLNLYPSRREVGLVAATVSGVAFVPVEWTCVNNLIFQKEEISNLSATFQFKTNVNSYQNAPAPTNALFSTQYPGAAGTAYIGALTFVVPEYIPRGGTATLEVNMDYSQQRTTTYQYQYKLVGVLSGYKRVKAFK